MSDDVAPNKYVSEKLIPAGVYDDRQVAYIGALDAYFQSVDITKFIMVDAFKVDAKLLPALAVERSIQYMIEPGLNENSIRNLIANSYALHEKQGYIEGVRIGLSALGVNVQWDQWWQQTPMGAPNTHKVAVFFDQLLFENSQIGDQKHRNAVNRVINATKRWSQETSVSFGAITKASQFKGIIASFGARVTAALPSEVSQEPVTLIPFPVPHGGGLFTARLEN